MSNAQIAGVVAGGVAVAAAVLAMQVSEAIYVFDSDRTALRKSGVVFYAAPLRSLWDSTCRGDAAFVQTVWLHCNAARSVGPVGPVGPAVEFLTFERRFSGAPLAAMLGGGGGKSWGPDNRTYRIPRSAFETITSHRIGDAERATLIERHALAPERVRNGPGTERA